MPDCGAVLYDLVSLDLCDSFPGWERYTDSGVPGRVYPLPEAGYRVYARASLLRSLLKKLEPSGDALKNANDAAYALFEDLNDKCAAWELHLEHLGPHDEVILGEFRNLVYHFFHKNGYSLLDHAEIERHVDFGPGSAPGTGDCSFLSKLGHSSISAPNTALRELFYEWVMSHPTRLDCEITRVLVKGQVTIQSPRQLTAVAKTNEISRLVHAEPLVGMFFQKGIQAILESRLKELFDIDLSYQPAVNAELARIGSLNGSYGTIDLKSASDTIAVSLCDWAIPKSSLAWLKLTRTEKVVLPKRTVALEERDPTLVPLHMIATMGNAWCFPLQTALFTCCVVAVYRALGIPVDTGSLFVTETTIDKPPSLRGRMPNFGVNGDDIVVLSEAYNPLLRLLKCLGFIPNEEKSYNSGLFRESCGRDWYHGQDVRGVYIKRLHTSSDWYALINQLVDWSSAHSCPLTRTIAYCLSKVRRIEVPVWENPDVGIRMPIDCVKTPQVRVVQPRVEPGAHKWRVYRDERFSDELVLVWLPPVKPVKVWQRLYLYTRLERIGDSRSVFDAIAATTNMYWNSSAILLAAVRGMLRGGRVVVRNDTYRTRRAQVVSPGWDWPQRPEILPFRREWFAHARVYFQE